MKFINTIIFSLFSVSAIASTQNQAVKVVSDFDKQLAWSKTYLLNEIFTVNYSSAYENYKESGADMSKFWLSSTNMSSFRAAYLTAKLNNRFNDKNPLFTIFSSHMEQVAKVPEQSEKWERFKRTSNALNLSSVLQEALTQHELDPTLGKTWRESYLGANARCTIADQKKTLFVKMQEKRINNDLPITASNVITTIERWSASEVLCLAIELSRYPIRGKEYKKYSPLPLLQTLDAISSSLLCKTKGFR